MALIISVSRIRNPVIRDPDTGSGMAKNPDPRSGMNIPDNFSESLETVFRVKNS